MGRDSHPTSDATRGSSKVRDRQESYSTKIPATLSASRQSVTCLERRGYTHLNMVPEKVQEIEQEDGGTAGSICC